MMFKKVVFTVQIGLWTTYCLFSQQLFILNRGEQKIVSVALENPDIFLPDEITQSIFGGYDLIYDTDGGQLLWTSATEHQISAYSTEGGAEITTLPDINDAAPVDVEIDHQHEYLYWADNAQQTIFRSLLNGQELTPLVTDSIDNLSAIALWPAKNRLFYADIEQKRIYSCRLDGKDCFVIVKGDMETPVRLLVDTIQGLLYWSDDAMHRIERCAAFDGSSREVFYHGDEEEYPFGLLIDHVGGYFYWTDYGKDQIMRSALNGFEVSPVISFGLADPVALSLRPSGVQRPSERGGITGDGVLPPAVTAFPNPTNQSFTITAVHGVHTIETVSIYDGAGKLVARIPVYGRAVSLDTGTYPEGHYIYHATVNGKLLYGHFTVLH